MAVYDDITGLIGDTPLLRLDPARHGVAGVELYAKLEFYNPFGSVKDRIAWGMLKPHLAEIRDGKTLIEASSGNTAKALHILAGLHGSGLLALSNRTKVAEVRDVLRLIGAGLEELPGLSECPDPTVPDDAFSVIERRMAEIPGRFLHLSQYTNEDNVQTHVESTGQEILADLGAVDHLFGGLGTSGSTRGAAQALRAAVPDLHAVGVVSAADDFIPGIRSESEMWEVGLFRRELYQDIAAVRSADAIDGMLDLVKDFGVLGGPTAGAAYVAARRHLAVCEAGPRTAVIMICDRLEWYLSYLRVRRPDLFGSETPQEEAPAGALITPADLAERLDESDLLVVDTRGALAYRIGHLPGAINLRDDLLDQMIAQGNPFPAGQTVVLACPVGEYARRAAGILSRSGAHALALDGGVRAWRDAGLLLERSP
ncbi:pyridoxal-phosphate dependent enzyme [Kineosporia babensis]|uniref:Pyridoxal-phosphate dependent enzyme n=1 Tax=Kineosporia babensis TaxID=499548 RepID=A0A9X1T3X9_9ACTN|nr:pyridoxal-phosphate dependent enzyme [Kineosporia babensis]MCD5316183.1 pyridoxal-phosphate dependent enzyme [Kineosporia babensis]